jgi:transposase
MKLTHQVQKAWQTLRDRQRRLLRAWARGSPDAGLRVRCKIVLSLVRGHSPTVIQRGMQCSRSQVYRVGRRFVEQHLAGLVDRREDNGQAKITEQYEWLLVIAVALSPRHYGCARPTWTQELLVVVLQRLTGVRVSRTTISRLLRRLGARRNRPKPTVACPWSQARRTRRLRQIQRLVQEAPEDEVVLYVDEVDIHLNPKIGPDWMLPGLQKKVLTPGQNEKRYLAGAFNAHTGRLTWVESDRKNSDLFIDQLWTLVKEDYPHARKIHLILDNYRIHKSQRTQLAWDALKENVQLHFLPPYCPDENRIERVWKDLHDNVTRNHTCRTMKELMKEVRTYLRQRQQTGRHTYPKRHAA